MPKVVRKGDVNSAGGRTLTGSPGMIVDGKPVCPIGTPVSGHPPGPPHTPDGVPKTAVGSSSFIVDGKKVTVVGNPDTCGHPRVTGSDGFIVGLD